MDLCLQLGKRNLLSRWRKLHASWMGDSWNKLDGDAVEKEVLTVFKVMTKTSKVLANRELPACSENCLGIKEEVSVALSYSAISLAVEAQFLVSGHCRRFVPTILQLLCPDSKPGTSK